MHSGGEIAAENYGFRPVLGQAPDYNEGSDLFSIEYHFGGRFLADNRTYVDGEVKFMDNVPADYISLLMINDDVLHLGVSGYAYYMWSADGDFFKGLQPLKSDSDAYRMAQEALRADRYVHIYVVQKTEQEVMADLEEEKNLIDQACRRPCGVAIEEVEDQPSIPIQRPRQRALRSEPKLLVWYPMEEENTAAFREDDSVAAELRGAEDGVGAPDLRGDDGEGAHDLREEDENLGIENELNWRDIDLEQIDRLSSMPSSSHAQSGAFQREEFEWNDSDNDVDDSDYIQHTESEDIVTDLEPEDGEGEGAEGEEAEGGRDDGEEEREAENWEAGNPGDLEYDQVNPNELPEFDPSVGNSNPIFQVGMLFGSLDDVRDAINNYSILNKVCIKTYRRDKVRLNAKCSKCEGWHLKASLNKLLNSFQIKEYINSHSCGKEVPTKLITSKWLASKYKDHMRADPTWSNKSFAYQLDKDFSAKANKMKLWRAKKRAMSLLDNSALVQYSKVREYAWELIKTNPGSSCFVGCDNQIFQNMYVCLEACKSGFLAGCRPVIGLDGCWLKGVYGGQLLAAVGLDANDCIYPIAYAVVDIECKETWAWFLGNLGNDLNIQNSSPWTFMADKEKGLIQALDLLFPDAEKRYCVRHLWKNLCNVRTSRKGKALKDLLWAAATATYPAEYERAMKRVKNEDEEAWKWLQDKPPSQWSRSHFREFPKTDIILNNHSESFNNWIMEARDQPILTLMETIRTKLMGRMVMKRKLVQKYKEKNCPKGIKKLEKYKSLVAGCWARESGCGKYEVRYEDKSFVVDISTSTCSCRKWQLSGIPCQHAIASILEDRKKPEDYIHSCYSVENFRRAYVPIIHPMRDMADFDPLPIPSPPVKPPVVKAKRGRPKKVRTKGVEEQQQPTPSVGEDGSGVIGRKGTIVISCKNCGQQGHNKRTCGRNAEGGSSTSTSVQPEAVNLMPTRPPSAGQQGSVFISTNLPQAIPEAASAFSTPHQSEFIRTSVPASTQKGRGKRVATNPQARSGKRKPPSYPRSSQPNTPSSQPNTPSSQPPSSQPEHPSTQ